LWISRRRWDVNDRAIGQFDCSHSLNLLERLRVLKRLCVLELLDELDIFGLEVAHDSDLQSADWMSQNSRTVLCLAMALMSWYASQMRMEKR
jgi:hypothetical protein